MCNTTHTYILPHVLYCVGCYKHLEYKYTIYATLQDLIGIHNAEAIQLIHGYQTCTLGNHSNINISDKYDYHFCCEHL